MIRDFFKKVFRKGADSKLMSYPVEDKISTVKSSVTMVPGEYRYAKRPVTATEKTLHRIKQHREGLKNI